jgi:hypothetical protein
MMILFVLNQYNEQIFQCSTLPQMTSEFDQGMFSVSRTLGGGGGMKDW